MDLAKIKDRSATVGVIGLGYAGLPVALAFADAGFSVVGVDTDETHVERIRGGRTYLGTETANAIRRLIGSKKLALSHDYSSLASADAVMICVPTPLKDNQPDLSMVESAATELSGHMKVGALVVLESTSYPGTTEEVLKPIFEKEGKVAGQDFNLAFSPERIDPGNQSHAFREIPKIVGGVTGECGAAAAALYGTVVDEVRRVAGPKEAELAKLLENTFRNVNIALVNELAVYAHDLDINVWESIDAAASKPFGYMAFYPGPGVGGHCIGIDPSYLSWKVKQTQGHAFRFVELADELNRGMPKFVVTRLAELLNENGKSLKGSKILAIGVAYKPGIDDTRESPSLKVIELLIEKGSEVDFNDPFVARVKIGTDMLDSVEVDETALARYDAVVVLTPQPGVDYRVIAEKSQIVFDTRNALAEYGGSNVHRL